MKQLVEHIQKSIYGPTYYQELLARPFSFSWKYYSALALTVALFLTIVFSIHLIPKILEVTREFSSAFFAYYPDELVVHVERGIVSTNVPEPYFLPTPQALKGNMPMEGIGESLGVIDTKTPFSVEQFAMYKVAFWLGKDQIALYDGNGEIRIEPFDTKLDVNIDEGTLRGFEEKLRPFYKFAAPIVVIAIFLAMLILFGLNFVYLIFGAAVIFLLGRLLKQRWSYSTSYRIGLHALTLPLLLSTILNVLGLTSLELRFLFTAVMLAVVWVNFKDAVSGVTPLPPPVSPTSPLAPLS